MQRKRKSREQPLTDRAARKVCASTAQSTARSQAAVARKAREAMAHYVLDPSDLQPLSDPKNSGVAVYPLLGPAATASMRRRIGRAINEAPEFRGGSGGESLFCNSAVKVAAGGFGACNHPSSFHNEAVRALRMLAENAAIRHDWFGIENSEWLLEQIIDRMLVRRESQRPSAETWHRDVAAGAAPGNKVYGGWVNLNDEDQYFSCVPGSCHEVACGVGFAKIRKDQHVGIIERSHRIRIPPGSVLVFDENTVHEVLPSPFRGTQLRLFLGWRLSLDGGKGARPLIPGLDARIKDQEGMPLKSGQHRHYDQGPYGAIKCSAQAHGPSNPQGFKYNPGPPNYYPKAYWGQHAPHLAEEICGILNPKIVATRHFGKGTKRAAEYPDGVKCNLSLRDGGGAPDTLRSLAALQAHTGLPMMQPEYDDVEVAILKPQTFAFLKHLVRSDAAAKVASVH